MHPKLKSNPTAPSPSFVVKAITILCFASLLVSFVAYRSGFMDSNGSSTSMIDAFGRSGLDSNITPNLADSNFVIDEPVIAPSSKSARVFEPTTIMSSSKSMDMRRDIRIKDPDTSKKPTPTTRPITIMGGSKSGIVLSPAQQKRQAKKRKRQEKKNNKRKEANYKNKTKKRIMHSSKSGAMIEPRD